MKNNLKIQIIILFLFFSGCTNKGTSTGNPLVSISMTSSSNAASFSIQVYHWILEYILGAKAKALPAPATLVDSNQVTINLVTFWVNVAEFELKSTESSSEAEESEIAFEGPFAVDMLSSTPSSLSSINIVNNSLRRIKYKLKKIESISGTIPAEALNSSIYFTAQYNGFNLTLYVGEEIEIEHSGPNLVQLTNGSNLLVEIQIANLFKKINLSSISSSVIISENNKIVSSNPCPMIDSSATDLYTCIIKGFEQNAKVGKDDGDFEFDEDDETID